MVPSSPSCQVNWVTRSALELFHAGLNTHQIAEYWNITEAEAERRLSIERSNHKGLPIPYEASHAVDKGAPRALVRVDKASEGAKSP